MFTIDSQSYDVLLVFWSCMVNQRLCVIGIWL